jgi:hypothetical protein
MSEELADELDGAYCHKATLPKPCLLIQSIAVRQTFQAIKVLVHFFLQGS